MTTSSSTTADTLRTDIVIVGNGAIAKTAALGLAQAGHTVALLTPPSAPTAQAPKEEQDWDARVYALSHASRKLLSSLRVWEAMDQSRIAPVDSMQVNGDAPSAPGSLLFDAYGAHTDALAWIVEDRNLNMALDAAMKFAHNVQIVQGRATQLNTHGDGATVTLDSGVRLAASLVIGADGAQSWVRGQCDIGIDYRSYNQRAIVTNFACELPHHGVAHQWFTKDQGIVALLPLPGQRVSLVWSAPEAQAASLMQENAAQLAEKITQISQSRLGALKALDSDGSDAVKAFPLTLLRTHSLIAPHIALIGDAAHVVHPLAGQGMNLGFGDCAQLLKTLAEREPHRAQGDERVLARYARARAEDILLMQVATDGLARLFETDFEPLRVVRNAGMNLLDKFPYLKRKLIGHAMGR
ncbi:MAG TPA: UbiH/UbiF family hydroxylase [Burkholderiaceae bacterium]